MTLFLSLIRPSSSFHFHLEHGSNNQCAITVKPDQPQRSINGRSLFNPRSGTSGGEPLVWPSTLVTNRSFTSAMKRMECPDGQLSRCLCYIHSRRAGYFTPPRLRFRIGHPNAESLFVPL